MDFELIVSFLVRARLSCKLVRSPGGALKTLPSTSCWSCLLEFSWNDVAMPEFLRCAGGYSATEGAVDDGCGIKAIFVVKINFCLVFGRDYVVVTAYHYDMQMSV